MSTKLLKNSLIVKHDGVFKGSVVVDGDIISDVFEEGVSLPDESGFDEVIDLEGKYLLPGLIDVHVHFRIPGQEYKEDWNTGSKAALAGGVTSVLDMPNNNPSIVDGESLSKKRELVKNSALVNYGLYVGATDNNVVEVGKIKSAVGVKAYLGSSTGDLLLDTKSHFEKLMDETDKIVAVHAESELCILEETVKHEGQSEPRVHSMIRKPECAYEAVKGALHLAKKYEKKVHLCHVSTEKELEAVHKFMNENVSVEVTPHHLFLNTMDYERYGNMIKVNPPMRDPADQVALWKGINDGLVNVIATDHAPHTHEEKKRDYKEVPSGVPGVQTMLPLLLNAVSEGKISLEKVVELTSFNPSKIFKIKNKGIIAKGMDADLTVVDMDLVAKVEKDYLFSKCGWSPFENWELKGWPVMTFVNGEKMYEWRDKFGEKLAKELDCE